jgi:putative peptidoglycan lipid II flippase
MAIPLPRALGIDPRWGVAGLTASAGLAGWLEFAFLRRTLNRRIGRTGLPLSLVVKLWIASIAAAAAGWAVKLAIGHPNPILAAALILTPYGLVYFGVAAAFRLEEVRSLLRRLLPRAAR